MKKPLGIFPAYRDRITKRAREIARLIDPEAVPLLVPYRKVRAARSGECFHNVRDYVRLNGGNVVDGWVVWETPPLAVQAEFHSVWRNPDGQLIDITPPLTKGSFVTFIPAAAGLTYEGRNVHPYNLAYEDNEIARRWVEIAQRFQELAYPEGELQTPTFKLTGEMQQMMAEKGQILRHINGD